MKKNSLQANKHVFGPVASRRLGLSLGVDLVKHKTCTFNCIYCECGPTTKHSGKRKEYVSRSKVISELDKILASSPGLDYVTFSGSGEPTLNSALGKVIGFIKDKYPAYKVAVLTNSSLLGSSSVRRDLSRADVVEASLDAVSAAAFEKINRPCINIKPEEFIKGIEETARRIKGQLWIEIFIVPGINDTGEELKLIKQALERIKPAEIHINTLDRPGTESDVMPADTAALEKVRRFFLPLESRIIAHPYPGSRKGAFSAGKLEDMVLALLSRRPSTLEDLKTAFAVREEELKSHLLQLRNSGRISVIKKQRGDFYKIS